MRQRVDQPLDELRRSVPATDQANDTAHVDEASLNLA
jgi:hypothetical protein